MIYRNSQWQLNDYTRFFDSLSNFFSAKCLNLTSQPETITKNAHDLVLNNMPKLQ